MPSISSLPENVSIKKREVCQLTLYMSWVKRDLSIITCGYCMPIKVREYQKQSVGNRSLCWAIFVPFLHVSLLACGSSQRIVVLLMVVMRFAPMLFP